MVTYQGDDGRWGWSYTADGCETTSYGFDTEDLAAADGASFVAGLG